MDQPVYYVNGTFCAPAEAAVSVLDRGFLFGDALYEVTRVQNGALFRAQDHCDRMARGFGFLRIVPPFTDRAFGDLCLELARRNQVTTGTVYIQVTRGAVERTHLIPTGIGPTVFAFAKSADLPSWQDQPGGVSAITVPDIRWGRCDIKTTMLLPNSLAKQHAHDAGAYEAIQVSEEGVVREGASTNVCAVLDGVVRTHPRDPHVLPGITRQVVLDLARQAGIPVEEQAVSREELAVADEVFLTGTASDVCPVVILDGRAVGDGRIGPVTGKLIDLLAETLARETA